MEDSLREFEQRVTELKTRAEGLQSDQISNQELLKLQVILKYSVDVFVLHCATMASYLPAL